MDDILRVISLGISAVISWTLYFLGGWDVLLYSILILMTLDYVTGVMVALREKKFAFEIGFLGITKKFMIVILIALAVVIDGVLQTPGAIRALLIVWYSANEGLSIIENAGYLGVPVPEWFTDKLTQIKEEKEVK